MVATDCFAVFVKTAPSPTDEASAVTMVSALGLYIANTGCGLNSCLIVSNSCCWLAVHDQWFFGLTRSQSGLALSARCDLSDGLFPETFLLQ